MMWWGRWLAALLLVALTACLHRPNTGPIMALWRLDCGRFDIKDLEGTGPYAMPVSCYLIRHGDDYVLFDAGLGTALLNRPQVGERQTLSLDRTIADQLAAIDVPLAAITTLIVSHYHGDHHGQASMFPGARLVMGAADAAALREEVAKASEPGFALAPWLRGQRRMTGVSSDTDLYGDGTVTVLATPGHTKGHLSLMVRLPGGAYILTGDAVHLRSQLVGRIASSNHVDAVQSLLTIDRIKAMAAGNGAQIIVGHDRDDVALLPAFPEAAR